MVIAVLDDGENSEDDVEDTTPIAGLLLFATRGHPMESSKPWAVLGESAARRCTPPPVPSRLPTLLDVGLDAKSG